MMFMSVHNESGNVNGVALGSKTMNPIEPCVQTISAVSRESQAQIKRKERGDGVG